MVDFNDAEKTLAGKIKPDTQIKSDPGLTQ